MAQTEINLHFFCFNRQCRNTSYVKWETKLTFQAKISQEYLLKIIKLVSCLTKLRLTVKRVVLWLYMCNAAFKPGHMLPDTSCIHLLSTTCFLYRRQNCRQFVARLLLDTKGYKSTVRWTVIMSPRYSQHVSRTSKRVSGDMFPSTYVSGYKLLVRDTCVRATCVLV